MGFTFWLFSLKRMHSSDSFSSSSSSSDSLSAKDSLIIESMLPKGDNNDESIKINPLSLTKKPTTQKRGRAFSTIEKTNVPPLRLPGPSVSRFTSSKIGPTVITTSSTPPTKSPSNIATGKVGINSVPVPNQEQQQQEMAVVLDHSTARHLLTSTNTIKYTTAQLCESFSTLQSKMNRLEKQQEAILKTLGNLKDQLKHGLAGQPQVLIIPTNSIEQIGRLFDSTEIDQLIQTYTTQENNDDMLTL